MKRVLILLLIVLALVGGTYVSIQNSQDDFSISNRVMPSKDPRLVFDTPFRNVKPEVKYTGDASCAECHSAIDETYHKHPMGMSAHWTKDRPIEKEYSSGAPKSFSEQSCEFKVEQQEGAMLQTIKRTLSSGDAVAMKKIDAVIGVGSGHQGRSFLSWEKGTLWQSPVSFYQLADKWGISPGFNMSRGGRRAVVERCAVCHLGDVELVPGTENTYQPSLMKQQTSIGCERCHGPGELHVAERRMEDSQTLKPINDSDPKVDTSIVNPKHLSVELRLAICQQCHFSGKAEVEVRGRQLSEYRPGLPFHLFLAQFTVNEDPRSPKRTAQQIEQMRLSKCFIQSEGKMDCTSCHDPHSNPSDELKAEHYRQSCLKCHGEPDCKESSSNRQTVNDNCVVCHMPTSTNNVVAHTSQVDHSIPRKPGANSRGSNDAMSPDRIPIVPISTGEPQLDTEEQKRNLGIALVEYLRNEGRSDVVSWSRAKPSLIAAVKRDPLDAVALTCLSYVSSQTGEIESGFKYAQQAVKADPKSEKAAEQLVLIALKKGDATTAVSVGESLVDRFPQSMQHRMSLAKAYFLAKQFKKAEQLAIKSIEMNSLDPMPFVASAIAKHHLNNQSEAMLERQIGLELSSADLGLYEYLANWFHENTVATE